MRFKLDKNLDVIVASMAAPKDRETVAVELCQKFMDAGIIEDDPSWWGNMMCYVDGFADVEDICEVLSEYLYGTSDKPVPADVFDAFQLLIVMGDGPCPNCGGELKIVETKGHELKDGDYYTPNSYVIDYYIYECQECGETIKSEKEL